ncbi:MAG: DNA sulfur modification protein DndD [Bacillota bacterium]
MKINKITLHNFKGYFGSFSFDLSTTNQKNVILLGGQNGAGKTSLIEAIRVALLGPYAFGLKTYSDSYFEEVRRMLNKNALENKERHYSIQLDFDISEDLENQHYKFIRHWEIKNDRIKEKFDVVKDGDFLKEFGKEILLTKIREEYPRRLLDLCLFDGEEIGKIANSSFISSYLKSVSRILFNVDLFEKLEEDLNFYCRFELNQDSLSEVEKEYQIQEKNRESLLNRINDLEQEIQVLKQRIEQNSEEVELLKKDFFIYGGVSEAKKRKMLNDLNEKERLRQRNIESIRIFVSKWLPLLLVKDLLTRVNKQMELEQEYETYKYVEFKILHSDLDSLIETLKPHSLLSDKELNSILKNELLKLFQPSMDVPIHRPSFAQRSEINMLCQALSRMDLSKVLREFKENEELLAKIQSIRKRVQETDQNYDLKNMLEKIENLGTANEVLKQELLHKTETLENLMVELTCCENQLSTIRKRLSLSKKNQTSFILSNKIIEISEKFRYILLNKKLKEVSSEVREILADALHKNDLLRDISISPDTFDLIIKSERGTPIDIDQLSAGEKQVVLLSLTRALFKVSGRKLPMFFDTLLGRLDESHRENIISRLIPTFSDQVIILATDSEINAKNFKLLSPYLNSVYTINQTNDDGICIDKNRFFDFEHLEGKG